MKKFLSLIISLTVIASVCAVVLAYVNNLTYEPIKEMEVRLANDAAKAVMDSKCVNIEKKTINNVEAFVGRDGAGNIVSYAIVGSDGSGYGGDIELMVGFSPDGKVINYRQLKANETPGLGTKLMSEEFSGQFSSKSAPFKVTKDGGNIEAITSATVTSRAVCAAVNRAAKEINAFLTK